MNGRVVLVVLCILAASVLALAAAASDHRLEAGGNSVIEIEGGADRTTPDGTATPTSTPASTSTPTDDGTSRDDPTPTRTEEGSSRSGGATTTPDSAPDGDEETATPTETEAPDEPTPTTGPTPTADPGTETTEVSDDSSPMAAEPADDERAGFVGPALGSGVWIAAAIGVLLALALLTARRYRPG